MNKIFLMITIFSLVGFATEIPLKHASQRSFGNKIDLNAKIVQLSNAEQSIMSLVSGHIEKYYVKAGQSVKEGQKIVRMESMTVSKMTADFISLKKQLNAQEKNYKASQSLYKNGLTSMQELNKQSIKKDELLAKLTAVSSQLSALGINIKDIKKATSIFVLYAHSSGTVSAILQAQHSSVNENTPIITILKDKAFYLKSYLPLSYANKVKIGQKITIDVNSKTINSQVTQILPNLDEKTQRIVLLSSIDLNDEKLFINSYVSATLYIESSKKYIAVTKSALSFFNNEWVVFVPKEEEHEEHEEHGHEGLEESHEHEQKELEESHDDEHGEHEENSNVYEVHVIKIITQDEEFVAVDGLELGEEYVSDKSYYVKSQLLKSSLGGHGH